MKKTFKALKTGIENLIPSIGNLLIGITLLVIIETPKELIHTFKKNWKSSNNQIQKVSTIMAGLIISLFITYGFWGMYLDFELWRTSNWREEVLLSNYESNINIFFDKYNERFSAHDCDFMREVATDEAMYDKWGHEFWPKDEYSCEEFVRFQQKYIIPLKIGPIQKTGEKYRVKGEAIVIMINQGDPWKTEAIYFDLWKKLDWEIWHFNGPKNGPRKIPIEIY